MTTVSPPPNWYADPTGRHETRFWDGFTWTAHVADRGTAAVDPLVQPVAGAVDTAPRRELPVVGPGTAQLRAIAEARRAAIDASPSEVPTAARTGRRRPVVVDVAAIVAAAIVVLMVAFLVGRAWTQSDAGERADAADLATWTGSGYRLALPTGWVQGSVPAGAEGIVDATFVVNDRAPVLALVGPDAATRAQVRDAAGLTTYLQSSAGAISTPGATVTGTDVIVDGNRLVGVLDVDAPAADGTAVHSATYLVVGRDRSVGIMLVGTPDAIARHRAEAHAAAQSVSFR